MPSLTASAATASLTILATLGSNGSGMMYSGLSSSSVITEAIAFAAVSFMLSVMSVALT